MSMSHRVLRATTNIILELSRSTYYLISILFGPFFRACLKRVEEPLSQFQVFLDISVVPIWVRQQEFPQKKNAANVPFQPTMPPPKLDCWHSMLRYAPNFGRQRIQQPKISRPSWLLLGSSEQPCLTDWQPRRISSLQFLNQWS
jgi:hypothetical protein